ncbi:hypothetical protein VTO42DRAFT_6749 [Malbranchea cinnamomea]
MATVTRPPVRECGKPFLTSDILFRILLLVRESSTPAEFLPCLRVCKSFYRLAYPIFNSVVSLTDKSLKEYVLCSDSCGLQAESSTQVLTVRIKSSRPNRQNPSGLHWKLDELLRKLARLIKCNMASLRSFSLHIDDQSLEGKGPEFEEIRSAPSFKAASVIALLDALPETCTALEIDTSGFEVYQGKEHFCPHIAKVLPRLHHLRLRAGQVCPAFINPPHPFGTVCHDCPEAGRPPVATHLRSLVFNMELSSWIPSTKRCPWSSSRYPEPHTLHVEMARFLRCGYVNLNYFPVAKKLDIFAKVFVEGSSQWVVRRTDVRHYITFLHGSMSLLPNLDLHSSPPLSWRCIRMQDGRDIIAPHSCARELAEQSWRSTVDGARLPIDPEYSRIPIRPGFYFVPRWEGPFFSGNFALFRNQQRMMRSATDMELRMLMHMDETVLSVATYRTLNEIPDSEYPWPPGANWIPFSYSADE